MAKKPTPTPPAKGGKIDKLEDKPIPAPGSKTAVRAGAQSLARPQNIPAKLQKSETKKKLKNVDVLDILVVVGLVMLVLALFEFLMNNWSLALFIGSIGTLLCAAHYYSLPFKKVADKPTSVVTTKKATRPRKAWKFPRIPMPPKWVLVSAGRILGLLIAILILALLCKSIWWALTGGTNTQAVVAVVPPPPPIATALKTNAVLAVTIYAPNNSGVVVGVNYGTINERPVVVTNTIIENRTVEKDPPQTQQPVIGDTPVNLPISTDWSRPIYLPNPNVQIVDFECDAVENDVRYDELINGRTLYQNQSKDCLSIVNEPIRYIQWRISQYSPRPTGTMWYSVMPHHR